MCTTIKPITASELIAIPDDGYRYELVAGELRKMNPAGSEHGIVTLRVARRLANNIEKNDLGVSFGAETGFLIARDPDTVRAPYVAFVRRDRIPAEGIPQSYWPGAPDLAVEVVSPNDRVNMVDEKVKAWLQAGTMLVWVVNPRWRNVTVYRSATEITTLTENDTLDAGELIPGFQYQVGEFFV